MLLLMTYIHCKLGLYFRHLQKVPFTAKGSHLLSPSQYGTMFMNFVEKKVCYMPFVCSNVIDMSDMVDR